MRRPKPRSTRCRVWVGTNHIPHVPGRSTQRSIPRTWCAQGRTSNTLRCELCGAPLTRHDGTHSVQRQDDEDRPKRDWIQVQDASGGVHPRRLAEHSASDHQFIMDLSYATHGWVRRTACRRAKRASAGAACPSFRHMRDARNPWRASQNGCFTLKPLCKTQRINAASRQRLRRPVAKKR